MTRLSLLLVPLFCFAAVCAEAKADTTPTLKEQAVEDPGEGITEGAIPRFDENDGASDTPLRIEVKAEYKELKGEADFAAMNQTQSNHVTGGDRPFKVHTANGEGVEFKRWGFIVNTLPVIDPNNPTRVDTQIQLELSGPLSGKDGIEIETWQLQTEVLSTLGR